MLRCCLRQKVCSVSSLTSARCPSSSSEQPLDAGDTQRQQQRQQHQQQRQTDQQQEQPKGGDRLKTLLREVARSEELLKDCIHVREELGAAKMKIMRAREEARQTSRTRRSPCSLEFDGESWDWSDGVDFGGVEDSGRFGSDTANVGEEQEQLAAMAAAAPLVRDFADKMEELANVAPELSRSLAELTAVSLFFPFVACAVYYVHLPRVVMPSLHESGSQRW